MTPDDRCNFEANKLFAAITQLGINGAEPILDGEFRGGQCHIFKVSFKNEPSVAVRVPLYMDAGSPDAKIAALQAELRNHETLKAKGFRWAPRCRGSSLIFDNPIKHPFVVLAWIEGSQLSWGKNFPSQPMRNKVLSQMASVQLSLLECTLESGICHIKSRWENDTANHPC